MPAYQERLVDVNGVDTAVLTAGSGEPLVFFHGGGIVEGPDCFLPLAERFRLIFPYHPGFGRTASSPTVTGIGDWVKHYVALFDELGIGELQLMGHSLGGWLAALFAIDHGDRVRRLVLASPFGLDGGDHPPANFAAVAPEDVYGYLTRDASIFEGRVPSPLTEGFLADRMREGASIGQVAVGPYDPSLAERLAQLTTPTLLQWGDDDRTVPVQHAPAWEAALPNVTTKIYPGRGHLLFWEDRGAVDDAGDFLAAS
jgi:pimeloyl-ACP methyl ester carboxylesterase